MRTFKISPRYSYGPSLDDGNPGDIYEGDDPDDVLGVASGVSHSLSVVAVHLSVLSGCFWLSSLKVAFESAP